MNISGAKAARQARDHLLIETAGEMTYKPPDPIAKSNVSNETRARRASQWCLAQFDPVTAAAALDRHGCTGEWFLEQLFDLYESAKADKKFKPAAEILAELREQQARIAALDASVQDRLRDGHRVTAPPQPIRDPFVNACRRRVGKPLKFEGFAS